MSATSLILASPPEGNDYPTSPFELCGQAIPTSDLLEDTPDTIPLPYDDELLIEATDASKEGEEVSTAEVRKGKRPQSTPVKQIKAVKKRVLYDQLFSIKHNVQLAQVEKVLASMLPDWNMLSALDHKFETFKIESSAFSNGVVTQFKTLGLLHEALCTLWADLVGASRANTIEKWPALAYQATDHPLLNANRSIQELCLSMVKMHPAQVNNAMNSMYHVAVNRINKVAKLLFLMLIISPDAESTTMIRNHLDTLRSVKMSVTPFVLDKAQQM